MAPRPVVYAWGFSGSGRLGLEQTARASALGAGGRPPEAAPAGDARSLLGKTGLDVGPIFLVGRTSAMFSPLLWGGCWPILGLAKIFGGLKRCSPAGSSGNRMLH